MHNTFSPYVYIGATLVVMWSEKSSDNDDNASDCKDDYSLCQ